MPFHGNISARKMADFFLQITGDTTLRDMSLINCGKCSICKWRRKSCEKKKKKSMTHWMTVFCEGVGGKATVGCGSGLKRTFPFRHLSPQLPPLRTNKTVGLTRSKQSDWRNQVFLKIDWHALYPPGNISIMFHIMPSSAADFSTTALGAVLEDMTIHWFVGAVWMAVGISEGKKGQQMYALSPI